jgi:branched-chain amino acid transport system substrate-binding protein
MLQDDSQRRRRFLKASGLATTGLLAGCLDQLGDGGDGGGGGGGNGGGTSTGGGGSSEPVTIGATLPLSGAFSDTGVYVRDGYRHWESQLNEGDGLLGRDVELIIEDDQSEPSQGVSLLQRLINQENVDLLLGGYPGSTAAGQMQVADEQNMVYVSMGGHMSSFEQGFEFTFGAPPLMGQWWYNGFFNWLSTQPEDTRPTSAAAITIDNRDGEAVYECTTRNLDDLGIPLDMDERYTLPLDSAQSLVSQAKDMGADLFIANGFFPDGVQTVQAVHDVEYRPKALLQGVGSLTPAWEQELGELGNYIVSGTSMHPDLPFEGVDQLKQAASERYDRDTTPIYFMFGYSWAQTLQQGVEGAGTVDNPAVKDWLHDSCVQTVGGEYCFDERGLPDPIEYATQVQDGTAELVWPEDVATTDVVYPYGEQF